MNLIRPEYFVLHLEGGITNDQVVTSINDCLIDELLDLPTIVGPTRTGSLRHHDHDKLLLRVDPKECARVACPHELTL